MTAPETPALSGMSIGAVLDLLRPDFPDVTISKIRFLEAEGLVTPQRAASGYRRFTAYDCARLRFILTAQRDQYLPLKVIKAQLDAQPDGELPLARWVEVNATTPARMFGLYPRKGTIAPGSDADIVLYDPSARHVLSAASHHMAVDYSAYEGREVQGQVTTVMSRGEIILSGGEWRGQPGRGRFLPRGICQYLG